MDRRRAIAVLGAFSLFLSTIEYLIPKPLPFMRIGLANLPLMLGLDLLPFPSFMTLVAIKFVGQGIITGSLFSYIFLFSVAGTLASSLAMFALRRGLGPRRISFIGLGAVGALLSNLTQILLARFFIFGASALYIAPPFLALGVVSGLALGLFCEAFTARSVWYREARE